MFYLNVILLIFICSPLNVLSKENKTNLSSEKLYCASCSYEYTFAQLQNRSNWISPWSRCSNRTLTQSDFSATACHTLLRIDYARQYVTIYYNASYRSLKKLADDNQRIVFETTMATNGSQAQLKAFYECSFEDNCHLPLKQFLQLQTALKFVNYNFTQLIKQLNQFYNKPKQEIITYFHADTLSSTLTGYCGQMNLFDKQSLKLNQPKCLNKKSKLKSKIFKYNQELKTIVYTCQHQNNTFCNSDKKLNKFLKQVILNDYLKQFFGLNLS